MGKVGSSSVYQALKNVMPGADIHHVHFLSDKWLNEKLPAMHSLFHKNISAGNNIRKYIRLNPQKKIMIITLVREPIIREISNLFENWKVNYSDINKIPMDVLWKEISNDTFEFPLNWFDDDFKEYLGFDIYNTPFQMEKGFQIYCNGNFKILCIKLEKLNDVCSEAFQEFMRVNIHLSRENQSEKKKGSEQYLIMKNTFKMSKEKLTQIYGSKFVKHFYSEKEIEKLFNKWVE